MSNTNSDLILCCYDKKSVYLCLKTRNNVTKVDPKEDENNETKNDETKDDETKNDETKSDETKSDETKNDGSKNDEITNKMKPGEVITLPDAISVAIEAFTNISTPLLRPHLTGYSSLYKVVGSRKVYLVCLADCRKNGGSCICGWTTVKANDIVYLECNRRWYAKLWFRTRKIFI